MQLTFQWYFIRGLRAISMVNMFYDLSNMQKCDIHGCHSKNVLFISQTYIYLIYYFKLVHVSI